MSLSVSTNHYGCRNSLSSGLDLLPAMISTMSDGPQSTLTPQFGHRSHGGKPSNLTFPMSVSVQWPPASKQCYHRSEE
jgi:hypothetical protein